VCVGLGIFGGGSQVENMRIKYESFFRDLEIFDLIMFLCVENMLTVRSQPFSKVNIIRIASQAASVVGFDLDRAFLYFLEDARIGKDHVEIG